jgi:hypothetical protein
MRWATRRGLRIGGAATTWLVRRFIDPSAEFVFLAPGERPAAGEVGFDLEGAEWPPSDAKGRTPFEQLVQRYAWSDHGLRELAKIVGSAEIPARFHDHAEAPGLRAIGLGFGRAARDDAEVADRAAFLFDALYASLTDRLRSDPE